MTPVPLWCVACVDVSDVQVRTTCRAIPHMALCRWGRSMLRHVCQQCPQGPGVLQEGSLSDEQMGVLTEINEAFH